MSSVREKPVCSQCQGPILADAWAIWSDVAQDWEVRKLSGNFFCEGELCGEFVKASWIKLEEDPDAKIQEWVKALNELNEAEQNGEKI